MAGPSIGEAGALQAQALHAALAEDCRRCGPEKEPEAHRLVARSIAGKASQDVERLRLRDDLLRIGGGDIALESFAIDQGHAALEPAKFGKLDGREACLDRATPADETKLLDRRSGDRLGRVAAQIGFRHFSRCFREHAGAIDCHISVADDADGASGEARVEIAMVGMAVIPGDE